MAEYELNVDRWYTHWGAEHVRGDVVEIPGDIDDSQKAYIQELVDAGTLVEPGHAEKLREEQEEAERKAEERRLEQVEHDDAEAHRKVEAEQRRLQGDAKVEDDSQEAAEQSAGNEGSSSNSPKASTQRRSTGK